MPNIVYDGEYGIEPHFSADLFTKKKSEVIAFIESEKDRILADTQAFEADLDSKNPELRYGAQANIDAINKKSEKLQMVIDSI